MTPGCCCFLEFLGISDDYFKVPGVPMFVALYTLLNHVFQEKTPYGYTLWLWPFLTSGNVSICRSFLTFFSPVVPEKWWFHDMKISFFAWGPAVSFHISPMVGTSQGNCWYLLSVCCLSQSWLVLKVYPQLIIGKMMARLGWYPSCLTPQEAP